MSQLLSKLNVKRLNLYHRNTLLNYFSNHFIVSEDRMVNKLLESLTFSNVEIHDSKLILCVSFELLSKKCEERFTLFNFIECDAAKILVDKPLVTTIQVNDTISLQEYIEARSNVPYIYDIEEWFEEISLVVYLYNLIDASSIGFTSSEV